MSGELRSAKARDEWRHFWLLPLVASLGNSASVLHIYSLGPFIRPLQDEFGWGRGDVALGITVANCGAVFLYAVVGNLIDRWGPRRVGLIGAFIMCSAVALLGTATGTMSNWLFLWAIVSIGTVWVQPTIWTSAVSSRFDVSRGLAVAITLAGSGAASSLLPLVATWLIEGYGWRGGYLGLGALWAILLIPMLALFFRGAKEGGGKKAGPASALLPGFTFKEGIRRPAFYKLLIGGSFFSFCLIGIIVHFVPILTDKGITPLEAAGLAGIVGIASIAGRLVTGMLLDRFPGDRVGAAAFLLPISACLLLLLTPANPVTFAAVALLVGLSVGAELDVIVYMATRHFGLKRFGVLFAAILTASTVGTGLGPVTAGVLFDRFGSYDLFLIAVIPVMIIGAIAVGLLGPYPVFPAPEAEPPVQV